MADKTTVTYRERKSLTKWEKRFAYFWSAVYTWLAVAALVSAANAGLNVTSMFVLSVFVFIGWKTAIKYEFVDKHWSKWKTTTPVKERAESHEGQVFNVGLGAWEDDPNGN